MENENGEAFLKCGQNSPGTQTISSSPCASRSRRAPPAPHSSLAASPPKRRSCSNPKWLNTASSSATASKKISWSSIRAPRRRLAWPNGWDASLCDAMNAHDRILGGLWGALIGDALGVPVEFKDRAVRKLDPVSDMREYGTHHQPKGTWSDDGALILCTVESLLHSRLDTNDMGRRFVAWMNDGLWSATGEVFDVGLTTTEALMRIARGTPAEQAGGGDEYDNGNGSLMRILPVALRFADQSTITLLDRLSRASSITHAHGISKMACGFYGVMVSKLLMGSSPKEALDAARAEFTGSY